MVGRSAGREQADRGVDDRLLVDDLGQRPRLVASPAPASRCTAARVSAWRSGVPGLTKAAPGMCSPISSIIIWFELAVP